MATQKVGLYKGEVLRFPHDKSGLRRIEVKDGEGQYDVYRMAPSAAAWPASKVPDEVNPRSHGDECLKTSVAKAIENTLRDEPQNFWLANRGGFILAERVAFDPEKEVVEICLSDPNLHGIADGATTNAVIAKLQRAAKESEDAEERAALELALEKARFNLDVVVGLTDRDRIAALVEGRNTSRQVKGWSLADFRGNFDWLRSHIDRDGGPHSGRVGWEEYSPEDVKVLDVISVMTLFHPIYDSPAERRRRAPTVAFSSKGTSDKRLVDDRMASGYKELEPVLDDLLRLWEYVHAKFEPTYEQWNADAHGRSSKLARRKGVRRHSTLLPLTGIQTDYIVEKGLLFPVLGSLRALLQVSKRGMRWKCDPFEFFDKYGPDLMDLLMGLYEDAAGKNPATLGKMKIAYTSLHDRAKTLLQEERAAVGAAV